MNKKNVFLWTLYDFANSIAVIVFFLYFSQWLVIDKGVSDFWYNMIFTAGSVLLLVTAPIFGGIADKTGREQRYLNRTTLLFIGFLFATTVVTLFWSGQAYLAALFFLLANYFYQFSFVFYNALLPRIAPPEKWGRISGIGQTGNWLGQIAGILFTLPFAAGTVYLVGEAGRAQTFLPSVIIFFVLALPMLLFFRLPARKTQEPNPPLFQEYKEQWKRFRALIQLPGVGLFLLAYFLFNDAILTATNNFPLYLERVFAVSDTQKSTLMLGILLTSALGAFTSGWVADRIGLKKMLMGILVCWAIVFPLLGLATSFWWFVVLTILMGILYGSTWTVTRATMTALCPEDKLNFGFSFYTLSERTSTLVGPLFWGIITSFTALGIARYRLAMILLSLFIIAGVLLLRKVTVRTYAQLEGREVSPLPGLR